MKSVSFHTVRSDSDILKVSDLAHEIWREHYSAILSPDQIEYMLETMQSPGPIADQIRSGYVYALVRRAGRSVGYVAYKPDDPPGQLFISKIYLLKEERGRGYFRDIVALLDEIAAKAHLESMWLTVNRSNPSVAPYKALGFYITREQDVDIGGRYYEMNDYVMERPVQAAG